MMWLNGYLVNNSFLDNIPPLESAQGGMIMCEFCENSKIVRDDCVAFGYSMHVRTTILSNKRAIDTKFSTIEPFESSFRDKDFRVNYCPICGRDLRKQIDERANS